MGVFPMTLLRGVVYKENSMGPGLNLEGHQTKVLSSERVLNTLEMVNEIGSEPS